jgi:hypothetical protein
VRLVDESRPHAIWWEDEGRRLAASFNDYASAVILAPDAEDAAAVALGIAELQARDRRVVVADLTGDLATIQRLVVGADVHGVSDSFRFGVSLNRVAQRVGEGENLFVLPSGTEPVLDDDIYRNDRWRRLVAGFREVGALLLLVAPASAPSIAELIAFTDGAVTVGDVAPPSGVRPLFNARPPRTDRRQSTRLKGPSAMRDQAEADAIGRRRVLVGVAAAALIVAVGVAISAIANFASDDASSAPPTVASRDSTIDTTARTVDSAAAAVATELPLILDPADSSQSAGWSVELARFSTAMGALIRVRDELPASVPVRTFALVPSAADRTLWYRVLAGASTTRTGADSLLASLRSSKVVDDPSGGTVVNAPLAFRLEQDVAAGSAEPTVKGYVARGIPAYALLLGDGTATVYAGAFESTEQAALLIPSLRAAGIEPALVYRLGRTF